MSLRAPVLQPVRRRRPWATEIQRERRRPEEADLDEKIRQMLRDLGRALSDAIAESSDVDQALRRLQEEGYSLFIFLDRQGGRGAPRALERDEGTDDAWEPPAGLHGEPVFRIHGRDLSFLRSIGIDPTRRVRSRTRKPR